jgi:hypothetical protein
MLQRQKSLRHSKNWYVKDKMDAPIAQAMAIMKIGLTIS